MASRAAELAHVNHRTFPLLAICGSLNPPKPDVTFRNQQLALKSLHSRYDGKAPALIGGPKERRYFSEAPIIVSNINPFGELSTLKRLEMLIGKLIAMLTFTSLGRIFGQRVIDLHSTIEKDRLGRPISASTMCTSGFHFNRKKCLKTNAYADVVDCIDVTLTSGTSNNAVTQANTDCRQLGLTETFADDTAIRQLLALQSTGTSDVCRRTVDVYRSRTKTRHGIKSCKEQHDAGEYVTRIMIPGQIEASLGKECVTRLEQTPQRIQSQITDYLKKPQGIYESTQYLEQFIANIQSSSDINSKKHEQAQKTNQNIKVSLERYDKWLERISKANWLIRFIATFFCGWFIKRYPLLIEQLVRNELELRGRSHLKQLYCSIADILQNKRKDITDIRMAITKFRHMLQQESERVRTLSNEFYAPLGFELSSPKLINALRDKVHTVHGGQAKVREMIFDTFKQTFKSLEAFLQDDSAAIESTLTNFAMDLGKDTVMQMHILDAFDLLCPTLEEKRHHIGECIAQACGRLILIGQGNKPIPSLKYIMAPDKKTCDFTLDIANDINRLGGDWEGIVEEGWDEISFVWYLAGVSIPALIEDTYKIVAPIKDFKQLVHMGEDPVFSLAPFYDGTFRDIDRTIVQALCLGSIVKNKATYCLKTESGNIRLGDNLDEIRNTFIGDYPTLTNIYFEYVRSLARTQETLVDTTEKLTHLNNGEHIVKELPATAFKDALEIAELMLPYMKNLRLEQ